MEKAELDTVLFGAGFGAGDSSGFGHHYSLQLGNGWTISGYASIDGNAFDEVKLGSKQNPENRLHTQLQRHSAGTTYRCLSIGSLNAQITQIVAALTNVSETPDLLRCPKCKTRFVHTKEPRADQKWKPFLSCEGMMIKKGKPICDGTSDKLPALIRFT